MSIEGFTKVKITFEAEGIKIKDREKNVVLNSKENVFTIPVEIINSGSIPLKITVTAGNGYKITEGVITVKSNFRIILGSSLLLIFLLLSVLLALRMRLKKKNLETDTDEIS